ncbi:septum formation initiator family protein [Risungbinella massiliensis]|uniref:septum formation initiator family protein n=1 Tax=Risungbinella massiliensis TaxID=1329796 RepID=UPI0005CC147B|nr:septum formation initiator family protein [Risungbinella massiliensis]
MIPHHPRDNVLVFQNQKKSTVSQVEEEHLSDSPRPVKPKIQPKVRRFRLAWLIFMCCFIVWASIQLVVQQFRIWEKEDQLVVKKETLQQVQQEKTSLEKGISLLQEHQYLMELAHKYGYGKKGEKNYQPKETTE